MTIGNSLPPHLDRFVRDQIAAGRFHTEGEIIRAALQMLEESSHTAAGPAGSWSSAGGATLRPSATLNTWVVLRESSVGSGTADGPGRRNLRGLIADLRSDLSFDDIKEARTEMWASQLRDGFR